MTRREQNGGGRVIYVLFRGTRVYVPLLRLLLPSGENVARVGVRDPPEMDLEITFTWNTIIRRYRVRNA